MRIVSTVFVLLLLVAAGAALAAPLPTGEKDTEPYWTYQLSGTRAIYPEVEPNGSCATAQPSACGDVIDPAQINPAADWDYYRFHVTAGDPITVGTDQSGTQPTMDTYIYLYDPSCTQVAYDDDSGPGLYSLITNYTALMTGDYYLVVKAYSSTVVGYYKAFIICTPPATGACCTGAGICTVMTQAACVTALGTYMGDNTVCIPNPCPQPPPNDTCAGALPLERCSSGSIAGSMISCANDYNPGSTGCTGYNENGPDVTYVLNLLAGDIVHVVYTTPAYDGAIYMVTDCANVATSCVIGEDDPEPETWTYTVVTPGTYYIIADAYTSTTSGDFTLDWSVTCPAPTGACCFADGLCQLLTEAACQTAGGTWLGVAVLCEPNPCPQPPGACCTPSGECLFVLQAQCQPPNAWYGGPCTPNPCPPTPTEKTSWGRIKANYR